MHAITIPAASQLHFLANKNWLTAANKPAHKHSGTCCTAEWPYCLFAILWLWQISFMTQNLTLWSSVFIRGDLMLQHTVRCYNLTLLPVADTRGREGGRKPPPPPNNIYSSFSFEKWKHKKVSILRSGTVAYYLVHYSALLLSWLQQFVRLCVTLCNLVT